MYVAHKILQLFIYTGEYRKRRETFLKLTNIEVHQAVLSQWLLADLLWKVLVKATIQSPSENWKSDFQESPKYFGWCPKYKPFGVPTVWDHFEYSASLVI
jgi:hypothetical protein